MSFPLADPKTCRDNLEFLQWMKRFWDSNFGGQGYDAVGRRKGAPTDTPATVAPIRSGGAGNLAPGARTGGRTPVSGHRAGSAQGNSEIVLGLQSQVAEMTAHLDGLEKERDFYFAKVSYVILGITNGMYVLMFFFGTAPRY